VTKVSCGVWERGGGKVVGSGLERECTEPLAQERCRSVHCFPLPSGEPEADEEMEDPTS